MRHRVLALILPAAALAALVLASTSIAGSSSNTVSVAKGPRITGIKPSKLTIGQTLVITGKGFRPGKLTNTVVFSRRGAQSVFVKADEATKTQIKVVVPAKLIPFLTQKAGKPTSTRFQLRVLAKAISAEPTPKSLSPVVSPVTSDSTGTGTPPPPPPPPPSDCDKDGIPDHQEDDDDNDLLSDTREAELKLNACLADTDGDGVEDGYEYYAAIDFNSVALPYPGKRPYPNPLDATDANIDFDGDTLTSFEEYTAWVRYGNHQLPLNLSDGQPRTGGGTRDELRDIDDDGLRNYTEAHGPTSNAAWWSTFFKEEPAYKNTYAGTDWLDPDSDGDTRLDGADDIDHDGASNVYESTPGPDWVNPFNPCLPDPSVDICSDYFPSPDKVWSPFKEGFTKADVGPLPAPGGGPRPPR